MCWQMFCGDETGAYIAQFGSSQSRFGWGGADSPIYCPPSYLSPAGKTGDLALHSPADKTGTTKVYSDASNGSTATDLNVWESYVASALATTACDIAQHPFLCTTTGFESTSQKAGMTEIAFEKLGAPSLFLGHEAALAAFSHGRTTALVVDGGAGGLKVTPVVDGITLQRASRRSLRGGDFIDGRLVDMIEEKGLCGAGKSVVTRFEKTHGTKFSTGSVYRSFSISELMTDLKKSHIPQLQFGKVDLREVQTLVPTDNTSYELPDGTVIDFKKNPDMFRVAEAIYEETKFFPAAAVAGDAMDVDADGDAGAPDKRLLDVPLHKLCHEALTATEGDARKELLGNVVVCGGGSGFAGFDGRLQKELTGSTPSTYRTKVVTGKETRAHASWLGGSILSSLGSFQQLWLSKTEYEEYGTTLAIQRFP